MRIFFLTLFITLFSACSIKSYKHTSSKVFIIKSPKIKFADLGYLRSSDKSIELELFVAGKSFEKITINYLICTKDGCMPKSRFNSEYLSRFYPDDILQNILLGRAIFEGKTLEKNSNGFIQKIITKNVTILYKVTPKLIYFKDKKNKILIKIKGE